MRRAATLLSILIPLAVATGAAAADRADLVAAGKVAFAAKCGTCHGLDRATGKTQDAAGWETTVARMIAKSPGGFAAGDREAITAYLTGMSLFATSCNTSCHGTDRASEGRIQAAWASTIARMQRYAKGKIRDDDAALITGYLAAERPAKP